MAFLEFMVWDTRLPGMGSVSGGDVDELDTCFVEEEPGIERELLA